MQLAAYRWKQSFLKGIFKFCNIVSGVYVSASVIPSVTQFNELVKVGGLASLQKIDEFSSVIL
jgi:hypothetical protein